MYPFQLSSHFTPNKHPNAFSSESPSPAPPRLPLTPLPHTHCPPSAPSPSRTPSLPLAPPRSPPPHLPLTPLPHTHSSDPPSRRTRTRAPRPPLPAAAADLSLSRLARPLSSRSRFSHTPSRLNPRLSPYSAQNPASNRSSRHNSA